MDWRNTAENLAISIIIFLIGGFVGYKASRATSSDVINQLTPVITEAIKKETNKIVNEIKFENNKFKKNDSLKIIIDQKPTNDQKPINVTIKESDSIPNEKKGFFGRLFSKKE